MKNTVAALERQSGVDEWACWWSTTLEVKSGGWRATHVPSRATKKRRMETGGLLSTVGVSTRGRSGDDALDSGVTDRS